MPAGPSSSDEIPGRITHERIHVKLPEREPHHGRVIQVMPGNKVPVDVDGEECPIVWRESDGTSVADIEAGHARFASERAGGPREGEGGKQVRTAVVPSPKKP